MAPARRLLACALLVLVLSACARPAGEDGEGSTSLPASAGGAAGADLLLVTVDTLRHDALGFVGETRVATPNLDRLAASGRVFTHAHAHNVVTLPSHANILTGRYPHQHGVRDNGGFTLGPGPPTLAELLAAAGYATAAVVAAFPLDGRFGLGRGFELYDDAFPKGSQATEFVIAERRGDEVVARGMEWWRAQEGKRFLWLHLFDPHAPYAPPEPFASRFRGAPYLGEVAAVDHFLGPLLELVTGGERPALVAFTSDHGESLGEHGESTHGLFAYQATLKVPLVLWGSGIAPGRDDRLAGHVDLLPTLLAALEIASPPGLPGRDLLAARGDAPRELYFEALSTFFNRGWAPLRGILREHSKLVSLPLPELYDLAEDPREERNLAEARRSELRALHQGLPRETPWPPRRAALDDEVGRQLRTLGYLAGSAEHRERFGPEDDPKRLVHLDRKLHQVIDHYSRGELEQATRLAREVVAERPAMGMGYEHLALVLRQRERLEEALEVFAQAVAAGAATGSLLRQYGLTLAEAGRPRQAIEILEPLAADADPTTLNALAVAWSEAGEQPRAREILERALERDPRDPKTHENLGLVALRRERAGEAEEHLERALALNDRLPIAWNALGVARAWSGREAAAMDAWQRAVELDPRQLDALYNLGVTAARAGDRERARSALARYVATAPPERFAADIARARGLLAELEKR